MHEEASKTTGLYNYGKRGMTVQYQRDASSIPIGVQKLESSCQYLTNSMIKYLFLIENIWYFEKYLWTQNWIYMPPAETVTSEGINLPETSKLSYFLFLEVMFTIWHLSLFNTFHELSPGILFNLWQIRASVSPLLSCICTLQKNPTLRYNLKRTKE